MCNKYASSQALHSIIMCSIDVYEYYTDFVYDDNLCT